MGESHSQESPDRLPVFALEDLPPAPSHERGWPWTEASPALPETAPGGRPWPAIGIVTPSYNQGRYLEETIRSVLLQGYPALEYFVEEAEPCRGAGPLFS